MNWEETRRESYLEITIYQSILLFLYSTRLPFLLHISKDVLKEIKEKTLLTKKKLKKKHLRKLGGVFVDVLPGALQTEAQGR